MIQELRPGGAERVLLTLVDGALAAGAEVEVAAAAGPWSGLVPVRVHPLPVLDRSAAQVPRAAVALHRAIGSFRPDIVHAHNPGVALAAGLASVRGRRVPTLATCHGVPDDDYARAARVFRLAGGPVVACGPGVAAALGEHGVQAVSTVVNGVAAAPPPAERSAVERDYDVPPGAALLLCVGRLAPQKNHALAVRALADLPGAHLVILGDGPLRAELGRLATRLHVEDRLRLAGVRPDARAVMAAADVVLLPSRWEGLPLVALEALLSGTPLVATAGRGVRELLRDDVDALLVPVDDAAALAAGVRRVLTEPGLAQRLGESGRAAAASYTEARMVRDYLDLYAGLVR